MKQRVIEIVAGAAIALSLVLAWSEFREAERWRDALLPLAQRQQALDTDIEKTRANIASTRQSETELRTALEQAKAKKPPAAAANASPGLEFADLMQTNPELRTLFRQAYAIDLSSQWRRLYARAGLSPAQIERFEARMIEASEDRMDLQAVAKAQGLSTAQFADMRRQLADGVQAAQKEILGETGFEEMQRVERQQPIEGFLRSLGRLLAPTGNTLTPQQNDRLLEVFSAASSDFQQGRTVNLRSVDTGAVLLQAEGLLTPVQLGALRENLSLIELKKLSYQFLQQQNQAAAKK